MAQFIRSFLQILLGFALGFAVATYYLPSTRPATGPTPVAGNKAGVRTPAPNAPTPVATTPAPAPSEKSTLFGHSKGADTSVANSGTVTQQPVPAAPVAQPEARPEPALPDPAPVAPPVAVADEPVDFRELCIKPAAWPPIITLNKEINAQVMQGEEVIAEIPLSAGERLQVSKVFGDATAEVRAKGAKFIVKAADTDLAAQARVRLAEISGRPRAPAMAVTPAEPTPSPRAPTKDTAPTPPPAKSDDLDSKMRSLFGTPQKR